MYGYILRRLLAVIPVMLVVAVVIFALLHLAPGDPASTIAGDSASSDEIESIRVKLGLNFPLHQQFAIWIGHILQGDLGVSLYSNMPVNTLIAQRLEPTVSLALCTIVLAIALALPLGIIAAWKVRSVIDRLVMAVAVMGFSTPVFLIGYGLIYVFALKLHWLPVQGYTPLSEGLWPWLRSLILPSIALGLLYMALIARITRASMIEVMAEDYIRTARAKGLTTPVILLRHALKNAAVPIATIVGIGIAVLISGVVITETVFNIHGLGRLTVDAIIRRDYPIIQGVILLFSMTYVVINLLVDLSYSLFDPRIRY
jgi:peptide/nickel transport system permease protein